VYTQCIRKQNADKISDQKVITDVSI